MEQPVEKVDEPQKAEELDKVQLNENESKKSESDKNED